MGHWVEKKANEGHVIIPFFLENIKENNSQMWLFTHRNVAGRTHKPG